MIHDANKFPCAFGVNDLKPPFSVNTLGYRPNFAIFIHSSFQNILVTDRLDGDGVKFQVLPQILSSILVWTSQCKI